MAIRAASIWRLALIAVTRDKGHETALGVARYVINPDGSSCNFALAVADHVAGKGLGGKLMVSLMAACLLAGPLAVARIRSTTAAE